jgi:rhamnulokinase
VTNASTTGLMDPTTRRLDEELMAQLGLDPSLFAPFVQPGDRVGPIRSELVGRLGLPAPLAVVSVASHDTASAVVAVPARDERFAFLCCGTWSVLGLELEAPILTGDALEHGFSNELGLDGTVRFVRNTAGLWLLQECLRQWAAQGIPLVLEDLVRGAAAVAPFRTVIDPTRPAFGSVGDMPALIVAEALRTGQRPPTSPAEFTRCIFESLALEFRRSLQSAVAVADRPVEVLHIVGGGARNRLLCQLAANACRLPVVAGPAEASALGNALVQGRPLVMPGASRGELRSFLRSHLELATFAPEGAEAPWREAARLVGDRL